MKPGRNAPCPCGSGRKYKQCCQSAETASSGAAGTVRNPFREPLRPQVREAAAAEGVWEVEAIPVPVGIDDRASHRPVTVMLVAGDRLLGVDMRDRLGGEPDDVAAALEREVVRAATAVGNFPEGLTVRHAEIVEPLQERLGPRGLEVRHAETLPHLEPIARGFLEEMIGEAHWPPSSMADTWAAWRLPATLVGGIFAAAADFWRRAPWKVAGNVQAPTALLPSGRGWTACVLGNGGDEFGLALYSEQDDFVRTLLGEDPSAVIEGFRGQVVSLTFMGSSELPGAVTREARLGGWPTAGPDAFPMLITMNTPGGGVSRADAEDLIDLLRAIPDFVEAHAEELLLESDTEVPGRLLEWRHPATGVAIRYHGEEIAERVGRLAMEQGAGGLFGSDLQRILDELADELGEDADPEELREEIDRRTAAAMEDYNQQPQRELGGLSPDAVESLLTADWSDPEGPIRLNRELALEDLAGSELLANARLVLRVAYEREALPATQAGNLGMSVVSELLDQLRPAGFAGDVRGASKRTREEDVPGLHRLRVLLEVADLLVEQRRRFVLTPQGEAFLAESAAGELFAHLFEAYFRRLDFAYPYGEEWTGLQTTVGFTLSRLRRETKRWRTPEELLRRTVLPIVIEGAPKSKYAELPALLFAIRVLRALEAFGLMERKGEKEEGAILRSDRFRITPLYGRFLEFRS